MEFEYTHPSDSEGKEFWRIVNEAGTLEANTEYFYLLFARHFKESCLLAKHDGKAMGMVLGYRIPERPNTLFVWQVGVVKEAQGQGLGKRMLEALVELPANADVTHLGASVTASNGASRGLFKAFARDMDAELHIIETFMPAEDFPSEHEAEGFFDIGPFVNPQSAKESQS